MSGSGVREQRTILIVILVLFAVFLIAPMAVIFYFSFGAEQGPSVSWYAEILGTDRFWRALGNSIGISLLSALITTCLAFILAYAVNFTRIPKKLCGAMHLIALLPMLLPTITYGFAIIYAFGKKGLLTMTVFGGHQLFDIYGIGGMTIGYIIYTLPISYVLINNALHYIDPKYQIISRVLGDRPARTFYTAVFRPLYGTLATSLIQSFFFSFTDYGIPMAVGGKTEMISTMLYDEMLGSLPDFGSGSVVAVLMLVPSVVSIALLTYMERFNIRYSSRTEVGQPKKISRDLLWGIPAGLICLFIVGVFATIFVVPSVKSWPYRLQPTWEHFIDVFTDPELTKTFTNSLFVAVMTSIAGTITVYASGLISARSRLAPRHRHLLDSLALVINTIPGMVLGVAYMLTFSGTSLQNTFFLIIVSTIIHYYSTPYLMIKGALEKMDASWETTALLMGDTWFKTVHRIITPNAILTLAEIFRYYFVSSMVTVSAVIFIVGANTMVLTTKIKQLEHFEEFNDIFVLSLLILFTNLAVTGIIRLITDGVRKKYKEE
ncbi:MAG: ABC transporter permease subunit [Eubacteriales bacterium]|jgi:iron(III) transport system permease protein